MCSNMRGQLPSEVELVFRFMLPSLLRFRACCQTKFRHPLWVPDFSRHFHGLHRAQLDRADDMAHVDRLGSGPPLGVLAVLASKTEPAQALLLVLSEGRSL